MTRAKIIETLAKILCAGQMPFNAWERGDDSLRDVFREEATAALSALEAAGLAVVPVEPTRAITDAIIDTAQIHDEWGVNKYVSNPDAVYEAAQEKTK